MLIRLIFITGFLFSTAAISAQEIMGRVMNEKGSYVQGITVQTADHSLQTVTNKNGVFKISIYNFPDTIYFSARGFEPYKVIITEKILKDNNFEVVLLSTRQKVSSKTLQQLSKPLTDTVISKPGARKLYMPDSALATNGGVIYKSNLLTAGEIHEFGKWNSWEDFSKTDFKTWSEHWDINPQMRYAVQLMNENKKAVTSHEVYLINKKNETDTIWKAVTDNTGKAELWLQLKNNAPLTDVRIAAPGYKDVNAPILFSAGINVMQADATCTSSSTVDIAFMVDATGSMSDEIDYLKLELEDVMRKTFNRYTDLDINFAAVFYRDKTDEYLNRKIDFQADLLKVLNFIKLQKAAAGGDIPEAVNEAMSVALDSLHWSEDARTRLLFMLLDAPPHDETKEKIYKLIKKAAAMGVRIIPVVCSNADRSTEYLMRCMALATNGTYVFLTDNSGGGLPHQQPPANAYKAEFLNGLLQRIIEQMVVVNDCTPQLQTTVHKSLLVSYDNLKIATVSKNVLSVEIVKPVKELYMADFTGKILYRIATTDKQKKYTMNTSNLAAGVYLLKYITADNYWGADQVIVQ